MKTVINAIVIKNKEILLVKKKNIWILPGGKIEREESDLECLVREISEELSNTKLRDFNFYKEFRGITPYSKKEIIVKAYFTKINGKLYSPSEEIIDSEYIKDFNNYNISNITRDIINSLIKNNYL